MEDLFRSDRLVYRAIEDTPEDEEFMHLIQSDPVAFSNSDNALLAPMSKKESGEWKKSVQTKKLIGVIICLAPPLSNPALPSDTKAPPLTPIGCISLTGLKHKRARPSMYYLKVDEKLRRSWNRAFGSGLALPNPTAIRPDSSGQTFPRLDKCISGERDGELPTFVF